MAIASQVQSNLYHAATYVDFWKLETYDIRKEVRIVFLTKNLQSCFSNVTVRLIY